MIMEIIKMDRKDRMILDGEDDSYTLARDYTDAVINNQKELLRIDRSIDEKPAKPIEDTKIEAAEIKYDSAFARKIFDELEGDFETRTKKLAKIYGLEDEVEQHLVNFGPYRSHNDLDSIMKRAFCSKMDSLEVFVEDKKHIQEISRLRVTYELIKDTVKYGLKAILYGALLPSMQKKLAEKDNDNPLYYTRINSMMEMMVGISGFSYALIDYTKDGQSITNTSFYGASLLIFMSGFLRSLTSDLAGSPLVTSFYYLINGLKDIYSSKRKKLGQKIRIEPRIEETKQLPSPEPSVLEAFNELMEIESKRIEVELKKK